MADRRPRSIKPRETSRARELRRNSTAAESILWRRLRAGQVLGLRFRRQQPIGRFIADFYCSEMRLVIEIDGDTHAEREEYDESRTEWLAKEGYRVVRFMNTDVLSRLDAVMRVVYNECSGNNKNPSP